MWKESRGSCGVTAHCDFYVVCHLIPPPWSQMHKTLWGSSRKCIATFLRYQLRKSAYFCQFLKLRHITRGQKPWGAFHTHELGFIKTEAVVRSWHLAHISDRVIEWWWTAVVKVSFKQSQRYLKKNIEHPIGSGNADRKIIHLLWTIIGNRISVSIKLQRGN